MSQKAKREYLESIIPRYRQADRKLKGKILDEMCAVCGYKSRKGAIRKIHRHIRPLRLRPGPRPVYGHAVTQLLFQLWLSMRKICSKKMKAAIPHWITFMKNWESMNPETEALLRRVSPATIDRLLRPMKDQMKLKGLSTTKQGSFRKTKIPIRVHFDDITEPGHMQSDTVAHCGDSIEGAYGNSLTMTDIHSTWTENRAVWTKSSIRVFEQIRDIEESLPFPMKSYACDNGGEVLNQRIYQYFYESREEGRKVPLSRSRPYKKNDQAFVEQKNNTHVRELFEYERVSHPDVVKLMNEIYKEYWNPLQNFFIPSMKCIEKTRLGARMKKKYDEPKTPYQRLLDSADLSEEAKEALQARYKSLDPFRLSEGLNQRLELFFEAVKKKRHRWVA